MRRKPFSRWEEQFHHFIAHNTQRDSSVLTHKPSCCRNIGSGLSPGAQGTSPAARPTWPRTKPGLHRGASEVQPGRLSQTRPRTETMGKGKEQHLGGRGKCGKESLLLRHTKKKISIYICWQASPPGVCLHELEQQILARNPK